MLGKSQFTPRRRIDKEYKDGLKRQVKTFVPDLKDTKQAQVIKILEALLYYTLHEAIEGNGAILLPIFDVLMQIFKNNKIIELRVYEENLLFKLQSIFSAFYQKTPAQFIILLSKIQSYISFIKEPLLKIETPLTDLNDRAPKVDAEGHALRMLLLKSLNDKDASVPLFAAKNILKESKKPQNEKVREAFKFIATLNVIFLAKGEPPLPASMFKDLLNACVVVPTGSHFPIELLQQLERLRIIHEICEEIFGTSHLKLDGDTDLDLNVNSYLTVFIDLKNDCLRSLKEHLSQLELTHKLDCLHYFINHYDELATFEFLTDLLEISCRLNDYSKIQESHKSLSYALVLEEQETFRVLLSNKAAENPSDEKLQELNKTCIVPIICEQITLMANRMGELPDPILLKRIKAVVERNGLSDEPKVIAAYQPLVMQVVIYLMNGVNLLKGTIPENILMNYLRKKMLESPLPQMVDKSTQTSAAEPTQTSGAEPTLTPGAASIQVTDALVSEETRTDIVSLRFPR